VVLLAVLTDNASMVAGATTRWPVAPIGETQMTAPFDGRLLAVWRVVAVIESGNSQRLRRFWPLSVRR